MLDFGTVDRLPEGLPLPIGTALRLALDGDAESVHEMLRQEGFVKPTIDLDPDAVLDYLRPIIEPARVEEFAFTRAWMRTQAARIADPRSPAHQLGKQLNLPPSYLLIHRVTPEHDRRAVPAGRPRAAARRTAGLAAGVRRPGGERVGLTARAATGRGGTGCRRRRGSPPTRAGRGGRAERAAVEGPGLRRTRRNGLPPEAGRTAGPVPFGTGPCKHFVIASLLHHREGERPAGPQRDALGAALEPTGVQDPARLAFRLGFVQPLLHMGTGQGFWDELHFAGPVLPREVVRAVVVTRAADVEGS